MTVTLLITSKTGASHRELVPVAPQQIETGVAMDVSNAEAILAELEQLRTWMAERTGYEHEAERITRLLEGLERARQEADLEIFIG